MCAQIYMSIMASKAWHNASKHSSWCVPSPLGETPFGAGKTRGLLIQSFLENARNKQMHRSITAATKRWRDIVSPVKKQKLFDIQTQIPISQITQIHTPLAKKNWAIIFLQLITSDRGDFWSLPKGWEILMITFVEFHRPNFGRPFTLLHCHLTLCQWKRFGQDKTKAGPKLVIQQNLAPGMSFHSARGSIRSQKSTPSFSKSWHWSAEKSNWCNNHESLTDERNLQTPTCSWKKMCGC